MKKNEIFDWMDKQIVACDIQATPLDFNDPFYIKNASDTGNAIHVYGIDNLCKKLNMPFRVEEHDKHSMCHYFIYKNHKFFGLVHKEENS